LPMSMTMAHGAGLAVLAGVFSGSAPDCSLVACAPAKALCACGHDY